MAFTNFETKEINCKIAYFGPSGAGKTENLRSIFKNTSEEIKAGTLELAEDSAPTQFFDFLPVSLGHVNGFHLKLHLYTMPIHTLYETVVSVVLKGLDGFVFVADSQVEAMAENIKTLKDVKFLLSDHGYNVTDMPRIVQYNKRDLPDVTPLAILRQELNPLGMQDHEAVANLSRGTMDTLESMAKMVLKKLASE